VLEGAKTFFNDLKKELVKLGVKVEHDFIKLKSYKDDKSSGKVELIKDVGEVPNEILIVEDIVDTGLTVGFLLKHFSGKKIKIVSFLNKKDKNSIKIDYLGFEIPNKFVVGYGLDYNGKYRELKEIKII